MTESHYLRPDQQHPLFAAGIGRQHRLGRFVADHAFSLSLLLHVLRQAHCIVTTIISQAASGIDPNSIPLDSRVQ
jgi:hypothetical protein